MPTSNTTAYRNLGVLLRVGAQARMLGLLNFIVESNGTLVPPSINVRCACIGGADRACPACIVGGPGVGIYDTPGYELQPGATAMLTYSGSILYADGHLTITPTLGSKYELMVMGERGAQAQVNVTVS
jgi:hypothetical protein